MSRMIFSFCVLFGVRAEHFVIESDGNVIPFVAFQKKSREEEQQEDIMHQTVTGYGLDDVNAVSDRLDMFVPRSGAPPVGLTRELFVEEELSSSTSESFDSEGDLYFHTAGGTFAAPKVQTRKLLRSARPFRR